MKQMLQTLGGLPRRAVEIDRVWLFVALVVLALGLAWPQEAETSVAFVLGSLLDVAPFLLGSTLIAAYAGASGADNLIARAFQGRALPMIVLAALMGALSPFCSCGVIPLIAALLAMGVPLAPVMAFWLASPLMDPSMFLLTAGTLGTGFALAKTLAAIGVGLFGGVATHLLQRAGWFAEPLRTGIGNGGCAGGKVRAPKPVVWRFWHEAARRERFLKNAVDTLLFLAKWLTLAFLLQSLMLATVPDDLVQRLAGEGGWLTIAAATLVGVPAYLNGYAALPLVGGFIEQGMAPGAGMAFLLAGGVTSIPAAIAVWALARPPVFLAYIGYALVGTFTAGLLYGFVI